MGGHVTAVVLRIGFVALDESEGAEKFGFRAIAVDLEAFVVGEIDKTAVDYGRHPRRGFFGGSAPDFLSGFRGEGRETGCERTLIKVSASGEIGG